MISSLTYPSPRKYHLDNFTHEYPRPDPNPGGIVVFPRESIFKLRCLYLLSAPRVDLLERIEPTNTGNVIFFYRKSHQWVKKPLVLIEEIPRSTLTMNLWYLLRSPLYDLDDGRKREHGIKWGLNCEPLAINPYKSPSDSDITPYIDLKTLILPFCRVLGEIIDIDSREQESER